MSAAIDPEHRRAVLELVSGHRHAPSENESRLLWKAVSAIATGDGFLSRAERDHLLARMAGLLTDPDVIAEVIAWDGRDCDVAALLAELPGSDRVRRQAGAWVVYHGLAVAGADEELAPGELDAVVSVAEALGLDAPMVHALHKLVTEEADLRTRRIALLGGIA